MKKAKRTYMKELSIQKMLMPFVVMILAVIIVSFVSLSLVKKVRSDSNSLETELNSCLDLMEQKEERMSNIWVKLNITQKDVEMYDQIYQNASTAAELLAQELEIEKEKEPEIIEVCQIPYRSVSTYTDYNRAAKMEIMLEKLHLAEQAIDKAVIHDEDLRIAVGYMYLVSKDFDTLLRRGLPKGDKANEWFMDNMEYLEELDGMYHYFNEFNRQKLKTRVPQILKIQVNLIEGMQSYYFMT